MISTGQGTTPSLSAVEGFWFGIATPQIQTERLLASFENMGRRQCVLLVASWLMSLLSLSVLSPQHLIAQESQAKQAPTIAAAPAPPAPDIADLIPLAAALLGRLSSLERSLTAEVDLSSIERQIAKIDPIVDEYLGQLPELKASLGQRAGQLLALEAKIKNIGEELAGANELLTERIRTLGNLRKEWLAEQEQWNAWQTVLFNDDSLEEVKVTLTKVQNAIDTALRLLRQHLSPFLAMQEQVGHQQNRANTLMAEVKELLSLSSAQAEASPPLFSAPYLTQLREAMDESLHLSWSRTSWPTKEFFAQQGWIVLLQGALSCLLMVFFFRHRVQIEQSGQWRFVARHPLDVGLFVGLIVGLFFYRHPPTGVVLISAILIGFAAVRLFVALTENDWGRQFGYGLLTLTILTNLFYSFGLPVPLFRLYIFVGALVSFVFCLWWGRMSSQRQEARWFIWGARLVSSLFAFVLLAELWGESEIAEFFFVSSLRTVTIVVVYVLLRCFVHGGLQWGALYTSSSDDALIRSTTTILVRRLALICDIFLGVVLLSGFLRAWQVYDSPTEAITSLLAMHVQLGSQQLTVGHIVLSLTALAVAYLASWLLQTLLTQHAVTKRIMETGVSFAAARLIHYALMMIGFAIALVVLGIDLTKMSLLVSALGIGIGFGLQTIVSNFMSGLILLFEQPLRVGDTIELGGQLARIVKIGLRSTTVRTNDRANVIIPNSDLITNQVINWTLGDRYARSSIFVGVAYASDIALVMQTLKECAFVHPKVLHDPEPQVLFRSFGDSALNFELRVWVEDVDGRTRVESDLYQEIERRFRQMDIEIPFPQRALHLRP